MHTGFMGEYGFLTNYGGFTLPTLSYDIISAVHPSPPLNIERWFLPSPLNQCTIACIGHCQEALSSTPPFAPHFLPGQLHLCHRQLLRGPDACENKKGKMAGWKKALKEPLEPMVSTNIGQGLWTSYLIHLEPSISLMQKWQRSNLLPAWMQCLRLRVSCYKYNTWV